MVLAEFDGALHTSQSGDRHMNCAAQHRISGHMNRRERASRRTCTPPSFLKHWQKYGESDHG